jgi:paraquat-inducible protein B
MPRRFDPKVVGAFVIAAVALAVIAAVYLGAGRLLQRRVRFVVLFSENLTGLEVDAPVKFRGVPVGRVASIHLSMGSATEPLRDLRMPVVIELNQTRIRKMGGEIDLSDERAIRTLVDHGLRAHLAVESLLSNRRYVGLDILPGAPTAPPPPVPLPYPEIPVHSEPDWATLQTDASKLLSRIEALDLEGLVGDLRRAANSFERAGARIDQAGAALPGTLQAAEAAIASVRNAARALEVGMAPLNNDTRAAVVQLRSTLERAEAAIRHIDAIVDPGSPLVWQLGKTLEELQSSARAVRHFAEGMERDPSALVRGRSEVRR